MTAEATQHVVCWDNSDHPEWLDPAWCEETGIWPDNFAGCPVALSAKGNLKVSYLTEDEAKRAAEGMREDDYPLAYHYYCNVPLVCRVSVTLDGCGRPFPGTEHYHVASGGYREPEAAKHGEQ